MAFLSDIRSCFEYVGREKLAIDSARMGQLPLDSVSSSCRAFLYAVLELNRGKLKRAINFMSRAREQADDIEDLSYVLYVEGVLLSMCGDYKQAVKKQVRCAEICKLTGDRQLGCDTLLRLSTLHIKLGEPAMAQVYEKEAALIMPRDRGRI